MKRAIQVLVTCLVISLPDTAIAANWVMFEATGKRTLYADSTSITAPQNGVVKVWVKVDLSKDATVAPSTMIQHWEYMCAAHTTRVSSSVTYKADGTVIDSTTTQYAAFEDIVPDSVAQTLEQDICPKNSN